MSERRTVRNTAQDSAASLLLEHAVLGSAKAIERQEAEGQRELCQADVLPDRGSDDPAIQALGIEWGELVPGDKLFRYAALPLGWSKRAHADHSMWCDVLDAEGAVRARVFYKAAFYDRRAEIFPLRRSEGGAA